MALSDRLPDRPAASDITVVGVAGLAALIALLAVVAGPVGTAAGLAVGALALVLPSTHVVALAHVLLLPVVPTAAAWRLATWGALFVVLVGPARRIDGGARLATSTMAIAGGLWLGTTWLSGLATRAGALLLVGGIAAYVLHRYAVVTVRIDPGEAADE